jgi:hypothetical protein
MTAADSSYPRAAPGFSEEQMVVKKVDYMYWIIPN